MEDETVESSENDQEELDELNAKTPEQIIATARGMMEARCSECGGHGRLDYLRIGPAPWYMRILGAKQIRKIDKDAVCKHCNGTGKEVAEVLRLSPEIVDTAAASE